jgi:hypothetical protein
MPVIFREGGLRYFFFSNEGSPREAPHIHVKAEVATPKFGWSRNQSSPKAMASIRASLRVSYALSWTAET